MPPIEIPRILPEEEESVLSDDKIFVDAEGETFRERLIKKVYENTLSDEANLFSKIGIAYNRFWSEVHENKSLDLSEKINEIDKSIENLEEQQKIFDTINKDENLKVTEKKHREKDKEIKKLRNLRDKIQSKLENRQDKVNKRESKKQEIIDSALDYYDKKLVPIENKMEVLEVHLARVDLEFMGYGLKFDELLEQTRNCDKQLQDILGINYGRESIETLESEEDRISCKDLFDALIAAQNEIENIKLKKESLAKLRDQIQDNLRHTRSEVNSYHDKRNEFVREGRDKAIDIKTSDKTMDRRHYEGRRVMRIEASPDADKEDRFKLEELISDWNNEHDEEKYKINQEEFLNLSGTVIEHESSKTWFEEMVRLYLKIKGISSKEIDTLLGGETDDSPDPEADPEPELEVGPGAGRGAVPGFGEVIDGTGGGEGHTGGEGGPERREANELLDKGKELINTYREYVKHLGSEPKGDERKDYDEWIKRLTLLGTELSSKHTAREEKRADFESSGGELKDPRDIIVDRIIGDFDFDKLSEINDLIEKHVTVLYDPIKSNIFTYIADRLGMNYKELKEAWKFVDSQSAKMEESLNRIEKIENIAANKLAQSIQEKVNRMGFFHKEGVKGGNVVAIESFLENLGGIESADSYNKIFKNLGDAVNVENEVKQKFDEIIAKNPKMEDSQAWFEATETVYQDKIEKAWNKINEKLSEFTVTKDDENGVKADSPKGKYAENMANLRDDKAGKALAYLKEIFEGFDSGRKKEKIETEKKDKSKDESKDREAHAGGKEGDWLSDLENILNLPESELSPALGEAFAKIRKEYSSLDSDQEKQEIIDNLNLARSSVDDSSEAGRLLENFITLLNERLNAEGNFESKVNNPFLKGIIDELDKEIVQEYRLEKEGEMDQEFIKAIGEVEIYFGKEITADGLGEKDFVRLKKDTLVALDEIKFLAEPIGFEFFKHSYSRIKKVIEDTGIEDDGSFSYVRGMRRGGEKSSRGRFVSKAAVERYARMYGRDQANKRFNPDDYEDDREKNEDGIFDSIEGELKESSNLEKVRRYLDLAMEKDQEESVIKKAFEKALDVVEKEKDSEKKIKLIFTIAESQDSLNMAQESAESVSMVEKVFEDIKDGPYKNYLLDQATKLKESLKTIKTESKTDYKDAHGGGEPISEVKSDPNAYDISGLLDKDSDEAEKGLNEAYGGGEPNLEMKNDYSDYDIPVGLNKEIFEDGVGSTLKPKEKKFDEFRSNKDKFLDFIDSIKNTQDKSVLKELFKKAIENVFDESDTGQRAEMLLFISTEQEKLDFKSESKDTLLLAKSMAKNIEDADVRKKLLENIESRFIDNEKTYKDFDIPTGYSSDTQENPTILKESKKVDNFAFAHGGGEPISEDKLDLNAYDISRFLDKNSAKTKKGSNESHGGGEPISEDKLDLNAYDISSLLGKDSDKDTNIIENEPEADGELLKALLDSSNKDETSSEVNNNLESFDDEENMASSYDKIIQDIEKIDDLKERANEYKKVSDEMIDAGKKEEAEIFFNLAVEAIKNKIENVDDLYDKSFEYTEIAEEMVKNNRKDYASEFFNYAIETNKKQEKLDKKAKMFSIIALKQKEAGIDTEADKNFKLARETAEEIENDKIKGQIINSISQMEKWAEKSKK